MRWSFRTNGNFIDFVHTDETSLAVESTIVSLHNTSRAVSWSLPEDTTRISFTIDEVKYSNIPITDIDFDGTAMNSQDDFQTGIEAMFPGLAGGGAASYLVYTAYVNQDGTSAPTDTDLENTLGGAVVWSRNNTGVYYGLTPLAIAYNHIQSPFSDFSGSAGAYIPISDGATIIGYYTLIVGSDLGENKLRIEIYVVDETFTPVDWSTLSGQSIIPVDIKFFSA